MQFHKKWKCYSNFGIVLILAVLARCRDQVVQPEAAFVGGPGNCVH